MKSNEVKVTLNVKKKSKNATLILKNQKKIISKQF